MRACCEEWLLSGCSRPYAVLIRSRGQAFERQGTDKVCLVSISRVLGPAHHAARIRKQKSGRSQAIASRWGKAVYDFAGNQVVHGEGL